MSREGKTKKRQANESVIAGIEKRLLGHPTLRVGGETFTPAELIALFQSHTDLLNEIDATHAKLRDTVSRERRLAPRIRRLVRNLRAWVVSLYGLDAKAFGDFGWALPRKPGPKKVAAKVAAADKGRATRAARHTMGKRQKAKIKGSKG